MHKENPPTRPHPKSQHSHLGIPDHDKGSKLYKLLCLKEAFQLCKNWFGREEGWPDRLGKNTNVPNTQGSLLIWAVQREMPRFRSVHKELR